MIFYKLENVQRHIRFQIKYTYCSLKFLNDYSDRMMCDVMLTILFFLKQSSNIFLLLLRMPLPELPRIKFSHISDISIHKSCENTGTLVWQTFETKP